MANTLDELQGDEQQPPVKKQPPVTGSGLFGTTPFMKNDNVDKKPKPPVKPVVKKQPKIVKQPEELKPVADESFAELEDIFTKARDISNAKDFAESATTGSYLETNPVLGGSGIEEDITNIKNEQQKIFGKKAAIIIASKPKVKKVVADIIGNEGELMFDKEGNLANEFLIHDKAGNPEVNMAVIRDKVDRIVRSKGGGGGLTVDYVTAEVYGQAYGYMLKKEAEKMAKQELTAKGYQIDNEGRIVGVTKDEVNKELQNIIMTGASMQKTVRESQVAAFNKDFEPVKIKWQAEVDAIMQHAPVGFADIKREVELEYADERTDAMAREGKVAGSVQQINAKIEAKANKRFQEKNKDYFTEFLTPALAAYSSETTDLQTKHNDIFKRRAAELKESLLGKQQELSTRIDKTNKANQEYSVALQNAYEKVQAARVNNAAAQYFSMSRIDPTSFAKMFGQEFTKMFGSTVKTIGAYMGANGIPYGFTKEIQNFGSNLEQQFTGYKATFSEGYFDPMYWAQSTGGFAGTSFPAMASALITKNPYAIALIGNTLEGASMGGQRYLDGLAAGEDPATASREGQFVFNANQSMIAFDALWAKGFVDVFTNKSFFSKLSSTVLGSTGQALQESLQTTFEQGSTNLKSPFTKESAETFGETFGSSMLSLGLGHSGRFVMGNLSKYVPKQSVAAQIVMDMNEKHGTQRGAAIAEVLRMEGLINDEDVAVMKENVDFINSTMESAKHFELGKPEAAAYVGIRFEIRQLEQKKAAMADNEDAAVIDKQISDKRSLIDKIISGEQKVTVMTVAGTNISVLEDKAESLAQDADMQQSVNEGVITGEKFKQTTDATKEISVSNEKVVPESGTGEHQGVSEGQQPAGESQGAERQGAQPEANTGNSDLSGQEKEVKIVADEIRQSVREGKFQGLSPDVLDNAKDQDVVDFIYDQATQTTNDPLTGEPTTARPLLDKTFGKELVDRVIASKENLQPVKAIAEMNDEELLAHRDAVEASFANPTQVSVNSESSDSKMAPAKLGVVKTLINRLQQAFPKIAVVFNQKEFDAAVATNSQARQLLDKGGVVYGAVIGGKIYINPSYSNFNTPIHEFGHLWLAVAKEQNKELYDQGVKLVKNSPYYEATKNNPAYANLTEEELVDEALAAAIGDRGEQFVKEATKSSFSKWLTRLYNMLAKYAGIKNMSADEIQNLSLDDFTGYANMQLLSGEEIKTMNEAVPDHVFQMEEQTVDEAFDYISKNKRQVVEMREGTATASMMFAKDGSLYISTVINEQKGNGAASKLMEKIVDMADRYGIRLTLMAMPFSYQKGLNLTDLVAFYERKGFDIVRRLNEGTEEESVLMEYEPVKFQADDHPLMPTMRNFAEVVAEQERRKGSSLEQTKAAIEAAIRAKITQLRDKGQIKNGYLSLLSAAKSLSEEYAKSAQQKTKVENKNKVFGEPAVAAIVKDAEVMASEMQKQKKPAKKTKTQALAAVTKLVKARINDMFLAGEQPAGVSWISMMAQAEAIATDAVEAAYPKRMKSVQEEEQVVMSVREWINNAVSNQIRAIKATRIRISAIASIVKSVVNAAAIKYGVKASFTVAEVNKAMKEVIDSTFGQDVDIEAVEGIVPVINNLADKLIKRQLLNKTASLIEKLQASISNAKFGGFDRGVASMVQKLAEIDISFWKKSNITVEDLYDFNLFLGQMTERNPNTANLERAYQIATGVSELVQNSQTTELESLISKMNRISDKMKDGKADELDYKELLRVKEKAEELKNQAAEVKGLSDEEVKELNDAYEEMMAAMPENIDEMVADQIEEIAAEAADNSKRLSDAMENPIFRYSMPNSFIYKMFAQFVKMMSPEYVASQSPEWHSNFNSIVDEIFRGNINNGMFKLMNEYNRAKLAVAHRGWSNRVSAQTLSTKVGLVGFVNKMRSYVTDVFATRNPRVIADNIDIMMITALDRELGGEFDELEIGFLNKHIFLPIAKGINGAQGGFNDGLEYIQNAMNLLADKSNKRRIDIGIKKVMENLDASEVLGMKFNLWLKNATGKSNNGFYMEVGTRMATIIATQIDHISNLQEGQNQHDVVLLRNFMKQTADEYQGQTLKDKMAGQSIFAGMSTTDEMLDIIAYAILTDGGTTTLADKTSSELLGLLSENQRLAIASWRQHLTNQEQIVEATMLMTGRVNAFLQNYFPRIVVSEKNDGIFIDGEGRARNMTMQEIIASVNGVGAIIGVDSGQLKNRVSDSGRIDLNGSKVLKRNLETIHLVYNMKPVLEEIQGLGVASKEMEDANERDAKIFGDGVMMAAENRLADNLSAYEKATANRFSLGYRVVAAASKFARGYLLLRISRMVNDLTANIIKLTAALSFAKKDATVKAAKAFAVFHVQKEWKKYRQVAMDFQSHMHSIMSNYADNFMYEFSKDPKIVQREQMIQGWQDITPKQVGWMERFKQAFTHLTGEDFSTEEWASERGAYRLMYGDAAQRAVEAADVFVEAQVGSSSYVSQPIRYNLFIPVFGRLLRNVRNANGYRGKTFTVKRDDFGVSLFRFMQGYQSVQFSLFQSYMRGAFTTQQKGLKERATLVARAVTETLLPTAMYVTLGTAIGYLYATIAQAAASEPDEEKRRKMYDDLAKAQFGERWLKKFTAVSNEAVDLDWVTTRSLNAVASVGLNPNITSAMRIPYGYLLFIAWKQDAVANLKKFGGNRAKVAEGKQKIREIESFWFNVANIRPIEIAPTNEDYYESIRRYYKAGTESEAFSDIFRSIGSFGVFYDEAQRIITIQELLKKSDENQNLSKEELFVASGLKLFGYVMSQKMFSGSMAGATMNLLSGDATKFANMMIKDQQTIQTGYDIAKSKAEKAGKKKASKGRTKRASTRSRAKSRGTK